jgi:hypothetical protein
VGVEGWGLGVGGWGVGGFSYMSQQLYSSLCHTLTLPVAAPLRFPYPFRPEPFRP